MKSLLFVALALFGLAVVGRADRRRHSAPPACRGQAVRGRNRSASVGRRRAAVLPGIR